MSNGQIRCPECGSPWDGVSAFCPVCAYDFTETHFDTRPDPPHSTTTTFPEDSASPSLSEPSPYPPETQTGGVPTFNVPSGDVHRRRSVSGVWGRSVITGIVTSVRHSTVRPAHKGMFGCLAVLGVMVLGLVAAGPELLPALIPLLFFLFLFVIFFRLVGSFLRFGKKDTRREGPGFFSSVFSHFIGAYFSSVFARRHEPIPVIDIRLQDPDDDSRTYAVRIEGDIRSGDIQVGDVLDVEGSSYRGTIMFRHGYNQSTNSEIIVRSR